MEAVRLAVFSKHSVNLLCRQVILTNRGCRTLCRVTLEKDGCCGEVQGELSNNKAGLLVLHEWWGLNDHIREISAEFARRGNFLALAPDLYRGKTATNMEDAGELMSSLDWQGAVNDCNSAATYLKSRGCKSVGIVGFSMGGAIAMATAALSTSFTAAVSFYGIPATTLADPTSIKIPVQCHFGELDKIQGFSSPKDTEKLRQRFRKGKVPNEFYVYFASHGFVNPDSEYYNETARDHSLKRCLTFLGTHLSVNR